MSRISGQEPAQLRGFFLASSLSQAFLGSALPQVWPFQLYDGEAATNDALGWRGQPVQL